MTLTQRVLLAAAFAVTFVACNPKPAAVCGNEKVEEGEECDDGNKTPADACENDCTFTPAQTACGNGTVEGDEACDDGNQTAGDGCENDCTATPTDGGVTCGNGVKQGTEECDDGNRTAADGCENDCKVTPETRETCPGASLPAPDAGTCEVTTGDQGRLLTGVVLTPGKVFLGGQVFFDSAGIIQCVGCDCSATAGASTATKVTCPKGVISPGLINSHDHITFQGDPYTTTSDERYEHRHDWRNGMDGHTKIPNGGADTSPFNRIKWGELRQVMAGTTSVAGSGGQNGLLRNLDKPSTSASGGNQEGLGVGVAGAHYETFPLSDQSGTQLTSGCGYPLIDTPSVIPSDAAYLPHIAEGIETAARNEFLCTSSTANGGQNLLSARTAIIHGIGVRAADIGLIATARSSLIWSPRSNIVLYGDTAQVGTYKRMGVNIALGTDWVISGSMNLLRELRCAESLNAGYLNRPFTDGQLWGLVTSTAADATRTAAKIGRLEAGKVADIAIFRQTNSETYRSVLLANAPDVVLTVRGGKVLYGDQPLVQALTTDTCDGIDVCGVQKAACVSGEVGTALSALQTANASTYPLFFCGEPTDEPSCVPQRSATNVKNGSTTYLGVSSATDGDGDGVPDATDDCPGSFNPVRPMDNGVQGDGDADGLGDACDPCPLNANTFDCTPPDPNDVDGDGKLNAADNCPYDANPSQADADSDGIGDACDSCAAPNPGNSACPTTIYAIKDPASTLMGKRVALGNVLVTATIPSGFWLQVHESEAGYTSADYSGLFVYLPAHTVSSGDRVNITDAVVKDYFGQIELTNAVVVPGTSGNPLPTPVSATAAEIADNGSRAAQLESVLVTVSNVTVSDLAPAPGAGETAPTNEFAVDPGGLRVNDYLFLITPFVTVGETFTSITGIAEWRNEHFKLEPRFAADYVAGAPLLTAFGPSPTFARLGVTGPTVPDQLTVAIGRPAATDTAVTVTSDSADLAVADGGVIIIPAGSLSTLVPVTGVSRTDGGMTNLSAVIGAGTAKSASVQVLDGTETPLLIALTPATAPVAPGAVVTFTVRLDLPPTAATDVTLSLAPAAFGTIPATVSVAADKTTATFDLTAAAAATGSATVTAQLGTGTALTATVNVQVGTTGLVINEIDYDGVGTGDPDEFVEILNTGSSAVSLANVYLVFANGSATGAEYCAPAGTLPGCRIGLSSAAASLAPGEYLVVGTATALALAPAGALKITVSAGDSMQNGAPDAVGLWDSAQNKLLDSLSYEGATPARSISGTSFTFQEGAGATTTLADSNAAAGSISRKPNGMDTNENAADFAFTTTITPGAVNVP
ncbi:MAG: DUF4215 domain-containing protein [Myxococcaceae bacterium]